MHFRGETITSSGHGFIGIGRKRLLEILQDRARELGVVLHFDAECDPADTRWRGYDLVIASDGANSRFRDAQPQAFGVDVDVRANKFVWLGTSKVFDAFTFAFERRPQSAEALQRRLGAHVLVMVEGNHSNLVLDRYDRAGEPSFAPRARSALLTFDGVTIDIGSAIAIEGSDHVGA